MALEVAVRYHGHTLVGRAGQTKAWVQLEQGFGRGARYELIAIISTAFNLAKNKTMKCTSLASERAFNLILSMWNLLINFNL